MEEKLKYVHDNPEVYFTQKARDGVYICPVCGNGSGKSGTGVKLIKGQTFRYKCFKCGTSGDVINFYAAEHHLSSAESIGQVFKIYGLDSSSKNFADEAEKTVEEVAEDLKLASVIAEDIEKAAENLSQTNYFQRRGISEEITICYGCGFIKGWTHPKKRGNKNVVPSDRVIIPTSKESYVARIVEKQNRIPKMKAGASNIFNIDVLKTSKQNFVVVEGEFDALSIIEAGNRQETTLSLSAQRQMLINF